MPMTIKCGILLPTFTIFLPSIVRKLSITTAIPTATRMSASKRNIGAKEGVCPRITGAKRRKPGARGSLPPQETSINRDT
jgi:hypothetical protein